MEFIIIMGGIVIFMIVSFIDQKVIPRKCQRCGQVKKDVYKRPVYINRLNGSFHSLQRSWYYCDKCADNRSNIIVREEHDMSDFYDDDFYK